MIDNMFEDCDYEFGPLPIVAAFGFGRNPYAGKNSWPNRSARAKVQRRDPGGEDGGQFIEQGGMGGFNVTFADKKTRRVLGEYIGETGTSSKTSSPIFYVKDDPSGFPDGFYVVNGDNFDIYTGPVLTKLPKGTPLPEVTGSEARKAQDIASMQRLDAPLGWIKNDDGSYTTDDGEYTITPPSADNNNQWELSRKDTKYSEHKKLSDALKRVNELDTREGLSQQDADKVQDLLDEEVQLEQDAEGEGPAADAARTQLLDVNDSINQILGNVSKSEQDTQGKKTAKAPAVKLSDDRRRPSDATRQSIWDKQLTPGMQKAFNAVNAFNKKRASNSATAQDTIDTLAAIDRAFDTNYRTLDADVDSLRALMEEYVQLPQTYAYLKGQADKLPDSDPKKAELVAQLGQFKTRDSELKQQIVGLQQAISTRAKNNDQYADQPTVDTTTAVPDIAEFEAPSYGAKRGKGRPKGTGKNQIAAKQAQDAQKAPDATPEPEADQKPAADETPAGPTPEERKAEAEAKKAEAEARKAEAEADKAEAEVPAPIEEEATPAPAPAKAKKQGQVTDAPETGTTKTGTRSRVQNSKELDNAPTGTVVHRFSGNGTFDDSAFGTAGRDLLGEPSYIDSIIKGEDGEWYRISPKTGNPESKALNARSLRMNANDSYGSSMVFDKPDDGSTPETMYAQTAKGKADAETARQAKAQPAAPAPDTTPEPVAEVPADVTPEPIAPAQPKGMTPVEYRDLLENPFLDREQIAPAVIDKFDNEAGDLRALFDSGADGAALVAKAREISPAFVAEDDFEALRNKRINAGQRPSIADDNRVSLHNREIGALNGLKSDTPENRAQLAQLPSKEKDAYGKIVGEKTYGMELDALPTGARLKSIPHTRTDGSMGSGYLTKQEDGTWTYDSDGLVATDIKKIADNNRIAYAGSPAPEGATPAEEVTPDVTPDAETKNPLGLKVGDRIRYYNTVGMYGNTRFGTIQSINEEAGTAVIAVENPSASSPDFVRSSLDDILSAEISADAESVELDPSGDLKQQIADAIKAGKLLSFSFNGENRLVIPVNIDDGNDRRGIPAKLKARDSSGVTKSFSFDKIKPVEAETVAPVSDDATPAQEVELDVTGDVKAQIEKAIADGNDVVFHYKGSGTEATRRVVTPDSIWNNPQTGQDNFYGLQQGEDKKKNFTISKMENAPEVDKTTGVFKEYNPAQRTDPSTTNAGEDTPLTELGWDPEEDITIYRGVPKGVTDINPGDWVTDNPRLARDYAGNGDVIKMTVKAKDLLTDKSSGVTKEDGELIEEMVYLPQTTPQDVTPEADVVAEPQKATPNSMEELKKQLDEQAKEQRQEIVEETGFEPIDMLRDEPTSGISELEADIADAPTTEAEVAEADAITPTADETAAEAGADLDLITTRTTDEDYADEAYLPTEEQRNVIDAAVSELDVSVQALAGSGKTSTLVLAAKQLLKYHPDKKILYIAFNKTVQLEAEDRMPSENTEARTGDSLGYMGVDSSLRSKNNKGDALPNKIADHLGIPTTDKNREDLAHDLSKVIDKFSISDSDDISKEHFDAAGVEFSDKALAYAQMYWADINDPKGQIRVTNSHLTKIWALTKPDLGEAYGGGRKSFGKADVIFFDEAQDINPVMAKVIRDQNIQKIYVGDSNQAIYGFRGADDELDKVETDITLPMTRTFRFGQTLAGPGNRMLSLLKSKYKIIGAGKTDGTVVPTGSMADADAVLTRTNGGRFTEIIEELNKGRVVGLSRADKADAERMLATVRWLMFGGKKPYPTHEDFDGYTSWKQVSNDVIRKKASGKVETISNIFTNPKNNLDIPSIADALSKVKVISEDKNQTPIDYSDGASGAFGVGINYSIVDNGDGTIAMTVGGGYRQMEPYISLFRPSAFKYDATSKTYTMVGTPEEVKDTVDGIRGVPASDVDVIVSTAHKAKGLEWGKVRIGDDFRGPEPDEEGNLVFPEKQELNLAYVALTRAESEIDPGSLAWVYDYTDDTDEDPNAESRGLPDGVIQAGQPTPALEAVEEAPAESETTPVVEDVVEPVGTVENPVAPSAVAGQPEEVAEPETDVTTPAAPAAPASQAPSTPATPSVETPAGETEVVVEKQDTEAAPPPPPPLGGGDDAAPSSGPEGGDNTPSNSDDEDQRTQRQLQARLNADLRSSGQIMKGTGLYGWSSSFRSADGKPTIELNVGGIGMRPTPEAYAKRDADRLKKTTEMRNHLEGLGYVLEGDDATGFLKVTKIPQTPTKAPTSTTVDVFAAKKSDAPLMRNEDQSNLDPAPAETTDTGVEGVSNDPQVIADTYDNKDLKDALVTAVQNDEPGINIEGENGNTAIVPVENVRDALQKQGTNTNDVIDEALGEPEVQDVPAEILSTDDSKPSEDTVKRFVLGNLAQTRKTPKKWANAIDVIATDPAATDAQIDWAIGILDKQPNLLEVKDAKLPKLSKDIVDVQVSPGQVMGLIESIYPNAKKLSATGDLIVHEETYYDKKTKTNFVHQIGVVRTADEKFYVYGREINLATGESRSRRLSPFAHSPEALNNYIITQTVIKRDRLNKTLWFNKPNDRSHSYFIQDEGQIALEDGSTEPIHRREEPVHRDLVEAIRGALSQEDLSNQVIQAIYQDIARFGVGETALRKIQTDYNLDESSFAAIIDTLNAHESMQYKVRSYGVYVSADFEIPVEKGDVGWHRNEKTGEIRYGIIKRRQGTHSSKIYGYSDYVTFAPLVGSDANGNPLYGDETNITSKNFTIDKTAAGTDGSERIAAARDIINIPVSKPAVDTPAPKPPMEPAKPKVEVAIDRSEPTKPTVEVNGEAKPASANRTTSVKNFNPEDVDAAQLQAGDFFMTMDPEMGIPRLAEVVSAEFDDEAGTFKVTAIIPDNNTTATAFEQEWPVDADNGLSGQRMIAYRRPAPEPAVASDETVQELLRAMRAHDVSFLSAEDAAEISNFTGRYIGGEDFTQGEVDALLEKLAQTPLRNAAPTPAATAIQAAQDIVDADADSGDRDSLQNVVDEAKIKESELPEDSDEPNVLTGFTIKQNANGVYYPEGGIKKGSKLYKAIRRGEVIPPNFPFITSDTNWGGVMYFDSNGDRHWGQFGAAGAVLRVKDANGDYKYLLARRAKGMSTGGGKWSVPGGAHDDIADKSTPVVTSARELYEELGIDPTGMTVAGGAKKTVAPDWEYDYSVIDTADETIIDGIDLKKNPEISELGWFTADEIRALQANDEMHGDVDSQILDDIFGIGDAPATNPLIIDETIFTPDEEPDGFVDLTGFTQTSGKGGSNPGGTFQAPDGKKYYAKFQRSDMHAANEVAAAKLYDAAGVPSADINHGALEGKDNVTQSPIIYVDRNKSPQTDPALGKKTQEGFAIDAWLGNWDGVVNDNTLADANGDPIRMDVGGSLLFRAQGAPKGSQFGDTVTEIDSLRDPRINADAAAVYGSMTDAEITESAKKLLNISEDDIDNIVDDAFAGVDSANKTDVDALKATLKARRLDILNRFGLTESDSETPEDTTDGGATPDVTPEVTDVTPEPTVTTPTSAPDAAVGNAPEASYDPTTPAVMDRNFNAIMTNFNVIKDGQDGDSIRVEYGYVDESGLNQMRIIGVRKSNGVWKPSKDTDSKTQIFDYDNGVVSLTDDELIAKLDALGSDKSESSKVLRFGSRANNDGTEITAQMLKYGYSPLGTPTSPYVPETMFSTTEEIKLNLATSGWSNGSFVGYTPNGDSVSYSPSALLARMNAGEKFEIGTPRGAVALGSPATHAWIDTPKKGDEMHTMDDILAESFIADENGEWISSVTGDVVSKFALNSRNNLRVGNGRRALAAGVGVSEAEFYNFDLNTRGGVSRASAASQAVINSIEPNRLITDGTVTYRVERTPRSTQFVNVATQETLSRSDMRKVWDLGQDKFRYLTGLEGLNVGDTVTETAAVYSSPVGTVLKQSYSFKAPNFKVSGVEISTHYTFNGSGWRDTSGGFVSDSTLVAQIKRGEISLSSADAPTSVPSTGTSPDTPAVVEDTTPVSSEKAAEVLAKVEALVADLSDDPSLEESINKKINVQFALGFNKATIDSMNVTQAQGLSDFIDALDVNNLTGVQYAEAVVRFSPDMNSALSNSRMRKDEILEAISQLDNQDFITREGKTILEAMDMIPEAINKTDHRLTNLEFHPRGELGNNSNRFMEIVNTIFPSLSNKPTTVNSKQELLDYQGKSPLIYRSVKTVRTGGTTYTPAELHRQLREDDGVWWGHGVFGQGHYFAEDVNLPLHSYQYNDGPGDANGVAVAKISADANILVSEDSSDTNFMSLVEFKNKVLYAYLISLGLVPGTREWNNKMNILDSQFLEDPGARAAFFGYDSLNLTNHNYHVILNRAVGVYYDGILTQWNNE